MALSPKYGWSEPDDTSFVKDGASAMRTLGNAIDTSVWNVGFGQAGKNKIINGDFSINQRNFTSVTATGTYTFDRWKSGLSGGTVTYTPQTFVLGAAPVAGYEGSTFLQVVTSGQSAAGDYAQLVQPIESVRTFAGQTVTMSFWAKATSGTPKLATEFSQWFGSGGSPSAQVNTYGGQVTISTSWARYSVTVTIPSISGKTLGTDKGDRLEPKIWFSAGSTFDARTGTLGIQTNTFSIWGVQVEAGSIATPFQTATGTIQGELAACQRYYVRLVNPLDSGARLSSSALNYNTTDGISFFALPVSLRTSASSIEFSTLRYIDFNLGIFVLSTVTNGGSTGNIANVAFVVSGMTTGRSGWITQNGISGFIAFNAEL